MKVVIRAMSSSGEGTYNVEFSNDGGKVTAFCDCSAGIHAKFCKHKWELMNGDSSMLADSAEQRSLDTVVGWIASSSFKEIYKKVNELEKQMESIKGLIRKEKSGVERKFREGF
jgi:hypothetical protein